MRYLHTMIRVHDLNESLDFFCNKLGLVESHRYVSEQGRFTLVYLYGTRRLMRIRPLRCRCH